MQKLLLSEKISSLWEGRQKYKHTTGWFGFGIGLLEILGLLASLALIFAMVIKKTGIGVALLAGSIVLGLLSLKPPGFAEVAAQAVLDRKTFELTAAVALIALLGAIYRVTGLLEELSRGLRRALPSDKLVVELIPAIFGLLPVLGGALMSAPVVDDVGDDLGLNSEEKTFLNLWFRHVVFFIYPVGTTFLLASYLAGIEVKPLILVQLPVFITSILAGHAIWLITEVEESKKDVESPFSKRELGKAIFPILLVASFGVIRRWLIIVGVLLSIAFLAIVRGLELETFRRALREARLLEMILVGIGVMVYRAVVEASGVTNMVASFIGGSSVPRVLLLILIPTILGFTLGTPTGTIALSIPLLSNLISIGAFETGLILTCSILGYVVSPLHACYTLTSEYFGASMLKVYMYLIPVTALTILSSATILVLFHA